MKISAIRANEIELTDAIEGYVTDKLEPVAKVAQDFEPAAIVHVELGKTTQHHQKGPHFRCALNLEVPKDTLFVEEKREDLYEAIDIATDQLRRRVRKHKEKLNDRNKKAQRPDKMEE